MNTEQAYIHGFVKRAAEYGFDENQAVELLKQAAGAPSVPFEFVKNIPKNMKRAVPPRVTGLKREHAKVLGALGAVGGGMTGAAHGLLNPGEEEDPKTGKMVAKSRLKAMLQDMGYGAAIGGGVGAAGGAYVGHKAQGPYGEAARRMFFQEDKVSMKDILERMAFVERARRNQRG